MQCRYRRKLNWCVFQKVCLRNNLPWWSSLCTCYYTVCLFVSVVLIVWLVGRAVQPAGAGGEQPRPACPHGLVWSGRQVRGPQKTHVWISAVDPDPESCPSLDPVPDFLSSSELFHIITEHYQFIPKCEQFFYNLLFFFKL